MPSVQPTKYHWIIKIKCPNINMKQSVLEAQQGKASPEAMSGDSAAQSLCTRRTLSTRPGHKYLPSSTRCQIDAVLSFSQQHR